MTDSTTAIAYKVKYPTINDARFRVPRLIIIPVLVDAGAAAASYYGFKPPCDITILKMQFAVHTEIIKAETTDPVINLKIATVEEATLTVPDTTAIGASVETDLINVECKSTEVLSVGVKTTAVSTGTETGKGYIHLWVVDKLIFS